MRKTNRERQARRKHLPVDDNNIPSTSGQQSARTTPAHVPRSKGYSSNRARAEPTEPPKAWTMAGILGGDGLWCNDMVGLHQYSGASTADRCMYSAFQRWSFYSLSHSPDDDEVFALYCTVLMMMKFLLSIAQSWWWWSFCSLLHSPNDEVFLFIAQS